jgi:hypothetical protein
MTRYSHNGKYLMFNGIYLSKPENCSGNGQSFNGIDQYLYVADNGDLDIKESITDFCFSGFIKLSNVSSLKYIMGKNVYRNNNYSRYGFFTLNNKIVFRIETLLDSSIIINTINNVNNDVEYHVLSRIDLINKKIYLYLDGILQNDGGTIFNGTFTNMDNIYEFYIGAGNTEDGLGVTYFSNCQVKDVRIYHKDITNKINDLLNNKKTGDEIAYWCLSNGNFNDLSGNGYHLSSVNI